MDYQVEKTGALAGKRVVLLGGSAGIGLATAKAAVAEGATVVLVSSNKQRVDAALSSLTAGNEGYAVDLSNEAAIKTFFKQIGSFDHLVFTAGENIKLSMLHETEISNVREYFNIRYWGAVAAVKYAVPHLNARGSIVLTSGVASARPGAGWSFGASITAAMEGFTRAMAIELAPIRVNAVSPGVVKTDLWDSIPEAERNNFYQSVAQSLPVKRVGEAADIAKTFIYLMTQQFSTGQIVVVDGGAVLV